MKPLSRFAAVVAWLLFSGHAMAGQSTATAKTVILSAPQPNGGTVQRKAIVRTAPTAIRTAPQAAKATPEPSGARPRFGGPGTVVNSVNFGSSVVKGAPVTMTLTYATPATTLTAAAAAGIDFAVTSSNCGTGGCSVVVTFTPGNPGLRYDAISLTDGSGNLVYETYVYGLGQAPQFGYELGNLTIYYGFTNSPQAVAIGPDEYVYYTSTGGSTIYKAARDFSSATTITLTGLASPSGIAVDGSNTLYVADQTNNQIISYTAAGVQGTVTTTPLSGPSQLAVDGTGALYIADTGNGRILKIDNQRSETTIASGLTSPTAVAVDSLGDVFYTDYANNGEYFELAAGSTTPTTPSYGINQVPRSLAVDASGAVYLTTDQGLNVFRPGYQVQYVATGNDAPTGLAIDRQGDVFETQPLDGTFTITDRTASNFILNTAPRTSTNGTLTISNTGNQPLTFSGFSTTGPLFTIDSSSQCVAGFVLQSNATCNVTIDFTPPAAMYYTDTMVAVSDSLNAPGTTDPFYLAGSGNGAPSTIALTASPNPVQSGNPVSLLISVADTMGFTPSGQVSILDGTTVLGTATLAASARAGTSTAQFTIPSLAVGSHDLTVTFPGDLNVSPSTSNQVNVTATNGPPPPNGGIPVTSQSFPNTPVGQTASAAIVYSPVSGSPVITTTLNQDFSVSTAVCGSSCTATVTFTPQFPGLRSDMVTVTDGGGNVLAQTFVSGIGTGPQFSFAESFGFYSTAYQTPMGIALGPDGSTFFFGDSGTNQVYVVTSGGTATSATNALPILNLGTPAGVAVDANQTVYVADQTNNLIVAYNLGTQVQGTVATSPLSKPTGLAVDGAGSLYIADTGNNRILKIDNQGNQTSVATGLNSPQGVAVDGAGNVYYADAGNGGEIMELPVGGGAAISLLSGEGNVHYVAVDASDTVYFTNDSVLSSVGPTGNVNEYHNFLALPPPYGVAVGPGGNIYVTIPGSGQWSVATRLALSTSVQSNVGVPYPIQYRINNLGNAPLTISGYSFSSPVVMLDPANPCTTVAPGANCYTEIDFTPAAAQAYQVAVTMASNSLNHAGSTNVLTVYGQGVAATTTSSTTTLVASSNAITLGQTVVLTATVSDTTAVTPTGTVNFVDGTTVIGSATLGTSTMAGTAQAQFTATSLAVGSHSITAAYLGDANVPASASAAQTVVVAKTTTTTTLILSAASIAVGHTETLTANVVGNGTVAPTGTVTFFDGTTSLGSTAVSGGVTGVTATLPVSTLAVGTHSITATYNGDANDTTSTAAAQTVTVTNLTTTTTLGISAASLPVGQPETLTATVAGAASPLTGTVTFFDGTTSLGSSAVTSTAAGGTATLVVSTLGVGTHSITARYSGDTNYALSTSAAQTVTITGIGTTTTLGISAASLTVGQTETLTATIAGAGTPAMTGTVTFFDGTTALGSSAVTATAMGGTATLALNTLAVGTHQITARYNGDANYPLSASAAQTVTITGIGTTTTLGISAASLTVGQTETLTATISGAGTPAMTGTVTFFDGTTSLGTGAVTSNASGGMATLVVSTLGIGTHPITARYSGDTNYALSVSAAQTVTVTALITTTSLGVSAASISVGQSETLTATVAGGATPVLSGTVTFFDGTTSLGSSAVTSTAMGGTATLALSTLGVGTHSITARYNGDTNYPVSSSAAQTVTVTTIGSATALGISAASISVGQAETLTATIAGAATPAMTGTVTFFDGSTSVGSAAVTATATGGTATLALSTLAAGTHSITARYGGDTNYALSVSAAQTVTVSLVAQTITFPAIANHTFGDAPFALSATASSGLAVSYSVSSGPATLSGTSVTLTGIGTVTIQATQAGNSTYAAATPVSRSFGVAGPPPTLASISPATALLGAGATTVTLTGTNFTTSDTVLLNGATVVPAFVSATALTAVIPASLLGAAGTITVAVFDPLSNTTTAVQTFTVAPAPAIVFTGPSTASSGQQPALTFQLVNPYPLALGGTLTLTFTPSGSTPVDDPAVQFATGGRTLAFAIPALSTATPSVLIQSGTVAGTVTITLVVTTAGGVNLTPTNVVPVVITIPAAVPAISTAAIARSGKTLTVTIDGFSNTRELSTATFHFTAASGNTISTPDITAPVATEFANWFTSAASNTYGSTFSYTQTFDLNNDASTVGSVTVTLVNSVGDSLQGTAQ
jgi:sugar lactone lactonase YvrE